MQVKDALCDIHVGPEAGRVLETCLRGAEQSIRAYAPFMSPMVARILRDKARHIGVEVFTPRAGDKWHRRAVKDLKGGFIHRLLFRPSPKVRSVPGHFHAKVFFIDDYVVLGSANPTFSGMRKNFETVVVCKEPEAVLEMDRFLAGLF
ncbi:MAG TPA: hypothetical protein ENN60_00065 [archaeon]|nr:hypothetical protein [archaeon]